MLRHLNNTKMQNTITTDASIFEIDPKGYIAPVNCEELISTIRKMLSNKQSFTIRAGGTSIGGQAIGDGVLIDVSKNLTNIINFSAYKKEVVVEPGVILDDLNDFLKPHNLKFAPDTSTSNRSMIGGMIGNNSCGAYSLIYGTTRDYVKSVEVILSDGSLVTFKELDQSELKQKMSLPTLEGNIYRFIYNLLTNKSNEILESFPDETLIRRNTGYAIDVLLRKHQPFNKNGKKFNLAPLMCGSEGTLGVIVRATLSLVKLPLYKSLVVAQFSSDYSAFNVLNKLIAYSPAAIEYMDKSTLDASKQNIEQSQNRTWINGSPEAALIIEFFSSKQEELKKRLENCCSYLLKNGSYHTEEINIKDHYKVWEIRKAGLGLLMGRVGPKKAITVIEDAAVPLKHLYTYYKHMKNFMHSNGTKAVYYGHASVGLIHIRPILNLADENDRNKMISIAKESSRMIKKHKGALSGEHGDGRIRSMFLKEQFGPNVYQYLVNLKQTFDPNNLLNPDVIISSQDMLQNIRNVYPSKDIIQTGFNWNKDISFFYATEKCSGAGVCRKSVGRGIMCPSYKAMRDDKYSTRGRANLLRRALESKNPYIELKNDVLKDALKFCLGCKACKKECPANVDMTKLKSEYLYQTQSQQNKFELWYTKNLGKIFKIGTYFPAIFNYFQNNPFVLKAIGFHRKMPTLQKDTLSMFWSKNSHHTNRHNITVWVLSDIFTEYHDINIGKELLAFLEACKVNIKVVPYSNSIVAMISKGLLNEAKNELKDLMVALDDVTKDDFIVGIEPSEVLVWRDEAKDLIEGKLPTILLFEELLLKLKKIDLLPKMNTLKSKIWLHTHCHQSTLADNNNLKNAISLIPNIELEVINTGCCGMAGDFGYKHPKISNTIAHQSLDELMKKIKNNDILISTGVSCRKQFLDVYSYNAKQLHQVFYNSII